MSLPSRPEMTHVWTYDYEGSKKKVAVLTFVVLPGYKSEGEYVEYHRPVVVAIVEDERGLLDDCPLRELRRI